MGLHVPEQTLMSAKSGLKISHAGFLDLIGITAGLQLLILQQHFFPFATAATTTAASFSFIVSEYF